MRTSSNNKNFWKKFYLKGKLLEIRKIVFLPFQLLRQINSMLQMMIFYPKNDTVRFLTYAQQLKIKTTKNGKTTIRLNNPSNNSPVQHLTCKISQTIQSTLDPIRRRFTKNCHI